MLCAMAGCTKQAVSRGLCPKHYRRWAKYGDPDVVKIMQFHGLSIKERFYLRLKQVGDCIEWIGYRDPNGYGRLSIKNIPVPVHRIAWEIYHGPIPEGMHVLHKCDNPPCVKESHLFLGTQADNNHDCIAKGRARHVANLGEAHGQAKLTEREVLEIRASSEKGTVLARQYGVSTSTISDIRKRKIWTHI